MIWFKGSPRAPVDGIILLAAYPPEGTDLSSRRVPATTLRGSEDGVVPQEDIDTSLVRLPADTEMVIIAGGNHAQFGAYGPQGGDNPATIPPDEQLTQTVEAIEHIADEASAD